MRVAEKTSTAAVVSALIKTIRLRQASLASLYLGYLWNLNIEAKARACRRIFICSAEDNTSIPVMMRVSDWFGGDVSGLDGAVRELLRISGTLNWYASEEGRRYIRSWWQSEKTENPHIGASEDVLLEKIELAVKSRAVLAGLQAFSSITRQRSYSRQRLIQCLKSLSRAIGNNSAMRLIEINEKHLKALWWDANVSGQCLYTLLVGPIGQQIDLEPDEAQVAAMTVRASSQTNAPEIPNWCLDGIHVPGADPRFSGSIKHMAAACRAFEFFGRLSPEDKWDSDTMLALRSDCE